MSAKHKTRRHERFKPGFVSDKDLPIVAAMLAALPNIGFKLKPGSDCVYVVDDSEALAIAIGLSTSALRRDAIKNEKVQEGLKQRLLDLDKPLSPLIRCALASLFNPNSPHKLVIKSRKAKSSGLLIAYDVALEILVHPGRWDAAIEAAKTRHGVSRATVTRAWKEHGELAKNIAAFWTLTEVV